MVVHSVAPKVDLLAAKKVVPLAASLVAWMVARKETKKVARMGHSTVGSKVVSKVAHLADYSAENLVSSWVGLLAVL